MAIAAQDLLREVIDTLQNANLKRWTIPEMCRVFNAGMIEIITLRPEAGTTVVTLNLAAGARQKLADATHTRLLSVVRNSGGQKRAIRLADRTVLDIEDPNWQNAAGVSEILHYTFDERDPTGFYVYPPATGGTQVEATVAKLPNAIPIPADGSVLTDVTGSLGLPDIYRGAMYDFCCARLFEKDAEYRVNAERGQAHMAAFLQKLGVEQNATRATSPRRSATESGTRPARAADS